MASTNVPFAQTKSRGTQRAGLVGHAGLSFILAVSRSGLRTRALQQPANKRNPAIFHLLASGGARAATYPKMIFRKLSHAGARRKSIPNPFLGCRLSLAATRARETVCCRRNAHIHALSYAMLDLVHHAFKWDQPSSVFAAKKRRPGNVSTLTMTAVGAAGRFVASSCPAVSTFASERVTRGFAVPAKSV